MQSPYPVDCQCGGLIRVTHAVPSPYGLPLSVYSWVSWVTTILFLFFSFFTFFVLHCPVWEIWVALPGYSTAAARAVLPIPTSVCSIFCVSKQQYGCQCLGFLVCTQMLMHAMAHGLCGHLKRVCAGSWLKEKSLAAIGDSNLHQYCAWLFSQTLYQLSHPRPTHI